VVDHLLQQGLDDHQGQAQLHDLAQIAFEEIQGVAQYIERIHQLISQVEISDPL
jgi:hypothetical protein